MKNNQILSVAIGGLLALGLVGNASAANKKMDMEQCFGIAKAGKNDCSKRYIALQRRNRLAGASLPRSFEKITQARLGGSA